MSKGNVHLKLDYHELNELVDAHTADVYMQKLTEWQQKVSLTRKRLTCRCANTSSSALQGTKLLLNPN